MKIVIAGGSGQVGAILARNFRSEDEVVVLTRNPNARTFARPVLWDGKTSGPWTNELNGADVVINLAGRSVNCRYSRRNRREILESRIDSVSAIGRAIQTVRQPPRVWLQAATATIYAHRFVAPNDEFTGMIGGNEIDAPDTWRFSIDVAKAWEAAAEEIGPLPSTRTVIMRSAMIMSPDRGGVLATLLGLVRVGLGGRATVSNLFPGFTSKTLFAPSSSSSKTTTFSEQSMFVLRILCRMPSSCASYGAHGGYASDFRRRSGCWKSVRSLCAPRRS